MNNFHHTENGRQRWDAADSVPRHRHNRAYAAIVLSGSYEESGSRGRFRVRPGDVLLHDAFDAHRDRFQGAGASILNLLLDRPVPAFGLGRLRDPDAVARAAALDPGEAEAELRAQIREARPVFADWPDILAAELLRDSECRLGSWAVRHRLSAETLSRGFGKAFGVTPAYFRAEVRAQRAWALIARSDASLASIAAATGFADQAHMSRATRALTGSPPNAWRKVKSVQDGRAHSR